MNLGPHASVSERLHDDLSQLLDSTQAGERLPSEPKLARQLGVSRATLREAMRTFETQGKIRRQQGSGTYVIHPSHVIESGLEVLESIGTMAERIGLPVSMGALAVAHRPPTEREKGVLGLVENAKVVHLARVISAEDRPVAYLIDVVPDDVLSPRELKGGFSGSVLDLFLQKGTPDLLTSKCEINADTANQETARALGIQRGDVVLRFVARLYDTDGRVVDYSTSNFLPGYFRFHVVRRVGQRL